MDRVTPEMAKAYVEWVAPAEVELKMPRVLGLIRAAFYAGWKARGDKAAEAMNEFCDRVECGEVRSRQTYAKFCEILARDPKAR